MPSLQDQLHHLKPSTQRVYSTDQGQLCPVCGQALAACCCADDADQLYLQGLDGILRLRKETSGRKGKGVTLLEGVPLTQAALKQFTAQLKKYCGTGGALKDRVIEIQGDQRDKLQPYLEQLGYRVKRSGG